MESSFWSFSFAVGLHEVDDTQRLQRDRTRAFGRDKRLTQLPSGTGWTGATGDRDNVTVLTTTTSDKTSINEFSFMKNFGRSKTSLIT
jgi:hypothetical protein